MPFRYNGKLPRVDPPRKILPSLSARTHFQLILLLPACFVNKEDDTLPFFMYALDCAEGHSFSPIHSPARKETELVYVEFTRRYNQLPVLSQVAPSTICRSIKGRHASASVRLIHTRMTYFTGPRTLRAMKSITQRLQSLSIPCGNRVLKNEPGFGLSIPSSEILSRLRSTPRNRNHSLLPTWTAGRTEVRATNSRTESLGFADLCIYLLLAALSTLQIQHPVKLRSVNNSVYTLTEAPFRTAAFRSLHQYCTPNS